MEPIKYKYSPARVLWDWFIFAFIELSFYMVLFGHNQTPNAQLIFGIISFLVLARLVYQSIYFYIPCLRGDTALEVDDEKVQYFVKSKIPFYRTIPLAYWKDIDSIDFFDPLKRSAVITINLKNGDRYSFPLKNVSGNDKDIYNAVNQCFEKYR